jgi:hypothetical protein
MKAIRSQVRSCHWNFTSTYSFRPHDGPDFDSASIRNEYQEYFFGGKHGWCMWLKTLLPSYPNCLEILRSLLTGPVIGLWRYCFIFTLIFISTFLISLDILYIVLNVNLTLYSRSADRFI